MLFQVVFVEGKPVLSVELADIHHNAISLSALDRLCGIRRHALDIDRAIAIVIAIAIAENDRRYVTVN